MKTFNAICKELNKENDEIFAKVCEILDERLDDDAVGIDLEDLTDDED